MKRGELGMIVDGGEVLYSFGDEVGNWTHGTNEHYLVMVKL